MQPRVWRVKGKWRRLMQLYFFFMIWVDFFMIRVDPSPILFYFLFFYSIRVDPTRTGSPGWSGPTFVPVKSQ